MASLAFQHRWELQHLKHGNAWGLRYLGFVSQNVSDLNALLTRLVRVPNAQDNKYTRGVVGFVTGSIAYPGAALLGVAAAESVGIGMTRYFGPDRVADLLLLQNPQTVVSKTVTAPSEQSATPAQRVDAWVLGSGVGSDDNLQLSNIDNALEQAQLAVIDAGALLRVDYEATKAKSLLLTPHEGELIRLLEHLGQPTREIDFSSVESRVGAARLAAKLTQQTVLLKGSVTVIAKANGHHLAVGPNSPYLATAGTGDVLAGILGALAATNSQLAAESWLEIAQLAVLLHSRAAELAAELGPAVAGSLPAQIYRILMGAAK